MLFAVSTDQKWVRVQEVVIRDDNGLLKSREGGPSCRSVNYGVEVVEVSVRRGQLTVSSEDFFMDSTSLRLYRHEPRHAGTENAYGRD